MVSQPSYYSSRLQGLHLSRTHVRTAVLVLPTARVFRATTMPLVRGYLAARRFTGPVDCVPSMVVARKCVSPEPCNQSILPYSMRG